MRVIGRVPTLVIILGFRRIVIMEKGGALGKATKVGVGALK